jgi:hypothetical protein
MKNLYNFSEILKKGENLEDLDLDGRIILRLLANKYSGGLL